MNLGHPTSSLIAVNLGFFSPSDLQGFGIHSQQVGPTDEGYIQLIRVSFGLTPKECFKDTWVSTCSGVYGCRIRLSRGSMNPETSRLCYGKFKT